MLATKTLGLFTKSFVFNKTNQNLQKLIHRYPLSIFSISSKEGFFTERSAIKLNLTGKLIYY